MRTGEEKKEDDERKIENVQTNCEWMHEHTFGSDF